MQLKETDYSSKFGPIDTNFVGISAAFTSIFMTNTWNIETETLLLEN